MRKTKIICTIGPATASYPMLEKMAAAGMDIVRLNMSHGDHESAAQVIKSIKTLNRKIDFPIAILMDTQGPEIRTGDLVKELELKNGAVISITIRDSVNVEETSFHIHYDDLIETVKVGDRIAQLLLEKCSMFEVEEIEEHTVTERGEGGFGSTGIKSKQPSPKMEPMPSVD